MIGQSTNATIDVFLVATLKLFLCSSPTASDVNKDLRHKAKTKAKDTTDKAKAKAKAPNKKMSKAKAKAKDSTDKAKTKAKDTTRPGQNSKNKLCSNSKPMPIGFGLITTKIMTINWQTGLLEPQLSK